jgi:hypothetical protein
MRTLVFFVLFVPCTVLVICGCVRGFNWLMRVIGLEDDSWPQGPR